MKNIEDSILEKEVLHLKSFDEDYKSYIDDQIDEVMNSILIEKYKETKEIYHINSIEYSVNKNENRKDTGLEYVVDTLYLKPSEKTFNYDLKVEKEGVNIIIPTKSGKEEISNIKIPNILKNKEPELIDFLEEYSQKFSDKTEGIIKEIEDKFLENIVFKSIENGMSL